MKQSLLNKRVLLVADQDYFPLLFSFKANHPDINLKIISKNSLIDKAGYRFEKDPLPFLIKEKNIEYNKAKKLLNLIKYLRNSPTNLLSEKVEELKDFLTIDEYGLYELKQFEIYLFEMDEDAGITTLLNNNNISFSFLHFEDLDIKNSDSFEKPNIVYFSNKFAQFSHIFSDIVKKIKEDESIKERIKIIVKDDSDIFYLSTISKLFNLDVYMVNETPVLADPAISKKVKEIYNNKSFEIEDNDSLLLLKELIEKYQINEIEDFDFAYANLLEILSSQKVETSFGDRGIAITTKYSFNPNDIIYVTNFEYGCFYKESSDNNVIPDYQLREMGLTTSYNKTSLDKRKKFNFIKFNNVALLSRVKQHLTDSIYDSHFIGKDNLYSKDLIKEHDKVDEANLNGLFSENMKLLMDAHRYDQSYFDMQHKEYRSYDNSFKGVNANELMVKEHWSVTNLEKYADCPFKYYLDALFVNLPGDLHHAYRGTLIHAVFEDILHDDFDFEKSFKKGVAAYIKHMSEMKEEFTDKEKTWIEMYHYWLKNIIPTLLRFKDCSHIIDNPKDYEKDITFYIGEYKFKGKIDKIIQSKNGEDYFYSIVDYKTGKEEFDSLALPTGKSIQLPLYYYAINKQNNPESYTGGGTFGGFYIQHPYFKSIKEAYVDTARFSEERLIKMSAFTGLSLSSESYWRSFDVTAFKEKKGFNVKNSVFTTAGDKTVFSAVDDESILLKKNDVNLSHYNINDIVEVSKNAAIRIINSIENNEFEIAPSSIKITEPLKLDNMKCKYCNHKNICYVNLAKDARSYYSFIHKVLKKEVN